LVADALAGFLPPNVDPPEGQGFVTFRVRPKTGLPSGTRIENAAEIVFDVNAPIVTNTTVNVIDEAPPASQVNELPATSNTSSFTVNWSGNDGAGAGVAFFDVFVSIDDGPFTLWQDDANATSAVYDGEPGHTYAFYSVARDHLGFVEDPPTAPDAQTLVSILPWTNGRDEHDVNDDDAVNLQDLLAVVTFLRTHGTVFDLPSPDDDLFPPPYVDINADGTASLQDLLAVVLELRTLLAQGNPEDESQTLAEELLDEEAPIAASAVDRVFAGWFTEDSESQ
jgi:hypothetical protein